MLVESGPALMAEFIKHDLADKFYFFIAPKIIGGDSPFNMFSGLGISEMDDIVKLDFDKIKRVGWRYFYNRLPVKIRPGNHFRLIADEMGYETAGLCKVFIK